MKRALNPGCISTEVFNGVYQGRQLELLVSQGRTYRGRVISLEGQIHPLGGGSIVKVHLTNADLLAGFLS